MIQLNNVSYPPRDSVLKNMSLDVRDGEIVGLIGKAGAGKSVLLKLISRQIKAPAVINEALKFKDKAISHFSQKELSRYMNVPMNTSPENPDEILENFLLLSRVPYKEFMSPFAEYDLTITDSFIERFGLSEFRRFPLKKLSASLLQRVLLAFAFIREPELLLLDNPTSNLDMEGEKRLYKEILKFTMDGDRSAIIASHDINFISQVCDRIIVLEDGKKAEDIPAEKLNNDILKTYLAVDTIITRNIYNGRPLVHLFPDN